MEITEKNEAEKPFEEVMAELSPNSWKSTYFQIQAAKHKSNSILLIMIRRKSRKNAEENMMYYVKRTAIQRIMDVLSETMKMK